MAYVPETTSDLAYLVQAYYEKTFLDNLKKKVVYLDFAKKYTIPRGFGPVIYFSRYTRFAANTTALSEATVPTANIRLTDERVSATVAQYGDFVMIGDLMHGTHISGPSQFVNQAVEELSYRAKLSIDALVRNALVSDTTVDSGAVYGYAQNQANWAALIGSSHTMTAADIRRSARTLMLADVPTYDEDSYIAVIGPGQKYDLEGENATGAWIDTQKYTSTSKIEKGEIGKLYGVRIVVSNNMSTASQSGTISACPFFGKESVAAIDLMEVAPGDRKLQHINLYIKEEGSAGTADPLNQLMTVGYKFNFTATRLADARVVILRAGQSA